jgi:hypothetical protein
MYSEFGVKTSFRLRRAFMQRCAVDFCSYFRPSLHALMQHNFKRFSEQVQLNGTNSQSELAPTIPKFNVLIILAVILHFPLKLEIYASLFHKYARKIPW